MLKSGVNTTNQIKVFTTYIVILYLFILGLYGISFVNWYNGRLEDSDMRDRVFIYCSDAFCEFIWQN